MGSIFSKLLRFSRELKSSITNQDEVLRILSTVTGDFPVEDNFVFNTAVVDKVVTTREDVTFTLQKDAQSYLLNITKSVPRNQPSDSSYGIQIGYFQDEALEVSHQTINLLETGFNEVLDFGYSLSDICTEVSVGQAMNEAIVGINDLFLSQTKVSINDVTSYISTLPSLSETDKVELVQTMVSASNQGFLSNFAWAGALTSLLKSGEESLEEGTILLREDSPFMVQSFFNTILTVATVIFESILGVLMMVVGGLIGIIAGVISTVMSLVSNVVGTDIHIDPDSNNEYVIGTFGANASFPYNQLYNSVSGIMRSDSAFRRVLGPFEMFTWLASNSADSVVNMNLFLNLSFDADRFFDYIVDGVVRDVVDQSPSPSITTLDFLSLRGSYTSIDFDNDYQLNSEQIMSIHFNNESLLRQYKKCVLVSSLMLLSWIDTYSVLSLGTSQSAVESMINNFLVAVSICKRDAITLEQLGDSYLPTVTQCRDYLLAITQHFNDPSLLTDVQSEFYLKTLPGSNGWGGMYTGSVMNCVPHAMCSAINYNPNVSPSYSIIHGDDLWDQLIPPPSVSLPDFSTGEVVAAIGVVLAAVGTVFIASKSIGRRLKARRQVKAAKRTQMLNDKRNAYLSNPNDKTLKKEYTNALISYDKRASIFGWPSYDAINGRLNVSGAGGVNSSLVNGFVSSIDNNDRIYSVIVGSAKQS